MKSCPRCAGPLLPEGTCPACLAAMAEHPSGPPVDENPLEPGTTFRGLEILGLIARGGMGIVYKARRPGRESLLAVKILPASLAAQSEFRDRFEREAGALAALGHPSIVGLHDFGIEGGLPFLVMDFVDGRGLRQTLRRGRLPAEEALRIAREVCDALEAAHQQGIVHRDIKPDNVLLDASGRVKITDFGLAKLMGLDATRLTESNLVIGTPHYMAPEQMERPMDVDRRADVYSFGVLLYEMLTGGLPIGRFALPSERGVGNPELDALVLRCLEADPAKRFSDATSLKAALLKATGAPPPPAPARLKSARNVPLTCGACGWTFFLPAHERGFVNCPSCRAPISVRAPGKASAPPPAEPAPPPPRRAVPPAVYAVAGVLFLGLVAAAVAVLRTPPPPSAAAPKPAPAPPIERPPVERPAPVPPKPPPPAAPADVVDYDGRLARAVQQCNLAGIVGAILFHTGRLEDFARVEERLSAFDGEIRLLDRRREASAPLPPYVRRGDRLEGLDDLRLDPAAPAEFAEGLRSWLKAFKAGTRSTIHLRREERPLVFQAEFPERTKDLNAIAHLIDVILGEANRVEPPPPPGPSPLPVELLAEIERKLAALHPYYRERVLAADEGRPRLLLNAAAGMPEDVDFLRQRVLGELLPAGAAELEEFRARIAELEPRAARPADAAPDVILFKDGRRIEGTPTPVDGGKVRIRGKIGSFTVDASEILRVEKGKGGLDDFASRWGPSKGKKDALEALLRWCADKGQKDARTLTAFALLTLDPGHEAARLAAGYAKAAGGAWTRGDPTAASNGEIEWHGRTYTPEQLARELTSLGYANLNGLWHARTPMTYKIDNLYRDGGKLLLRGGQVSSQTQSGTNMVYDVNARNWVPKTTAVSVGRFLSGPVAVEIVSPGEIIDCRVRARGQVADVGAVLRTSIKLSPDDKQPRPLYTLGGPGEHWQSIDVSDKVRGATRFLIHAEGGGLFLPSDSNDLAVLEVKYTYGQPLKRINELLAARGAAPEAPPAPDAAAIEAAVKRMAEVYAESRILTEMLRDMRTSVERLAYTKDVEIPVRFSGLAAMIEDPLRPKLEARPREELLRVGEWWGALPVDERRAFAYVYGLWCARWKALGK